MRRIGLLVPAADPMTEADFRRHLPAGLSFHATRLHETAASVVSDLANLDELVASAPDAARLVALVSPELIVFCCTSASLYKGPGWDREVARIITEATGIEATTTATAVLAAARALGLEGAFMLTPYPEATNRLEADFLAASGIRVTAFASLECGHATDLGRITPDAVMTGARAHRAAIEAAGALFVSCTALPVFDLIEGLEAELGLPVLSSNQANLWHTLALLGVEAGGIPGGRLFSERARCVG